MPNGCKELWHLHYPIDIVTTQCLESHVLVSHTFPGWLAGCILDNDGADTLLFPLQAFNGFPYRWMLVTNQVTILVVPSLRDVICAWVVIYGRIVHIPRLHRIEGNDAHHPDASHLQPTLPVVAVNVRFVEVVDQRCCQGWCNRTQVCHASGHVSWWQKRKAIEHATEMAKVVVCAIGHNKPHFLNFPPCALCQVVKTELHLHILPEHTCHSTRDSQFEINHKWLN